MESCEDALSALNERLIDVNRKLELQDERNEENKELLLSMFEKVNKLDRKLEDYIQSTTTRIDAVEQKHPHSDENSVQNPRRDSHSNQHSNDGYVGEDEGGVPLQEFNPSSGRLGQAPMPLQEIAIPSLSSSTATSSATVGSVSRSYIEGFTIHGLSKVFMGKLWEKVYWFLILMGVIGFVAFKIHGFYLKHKRNEFRTEVRMVDNDYKFPVLKICSYNVMWEKSPY